MRAYEYVSGIIARLRGPKDKPLSAENVAPIRDKKDQDADSEKASEKTKLSCVRRYDGR